MLATYKQMLSGMDCIGMLDVGICVSAKQIFYADRIYSIHAHALVWNVNKKLIENQFRLSNPTIVSMVPYTKSIDLKKINPLYFLQMVWYVAKMPRTQHQLHYKRNSDRIICFKDTINGVNAVRLFQIMADISLDQITFAHGEGEQVFSRILNRLVRLRKSTVLKGRAVRT